jgi:hypothetical protein
LVSVAEKEELIWAQVKGFVAKNNTTFRLKDAKELMYAVFGKITKDVLTKAEEHVVKIDALSNITKLGFFRAAIH